jgi:imidazolonepropionase
MAPRLHADELVPFGGAELAVELGAASADHLVTTSRTGVTALAVAADADEPVVATLLPAPTWYLAKERHAPARALIDAGVPVALGTDFNPDTAPVANLPLAMSLAVINLGMSPEEALAAVTINAARALLLDHEIGSLEPDKVADLVIWRVPTAADIPSWPGAGLVRTVVKKGRIVLERPDR